ncbi:protein NCA1 [Magnolia sinica]|uniref:protein NCA1 n=1 Tax=Magnolia sinica TaxID=86752 RepID=UPI00265B5850|nr:protein NCA1 [Magnolia sinica]
MSSVCPFAKATETGALCPVKSEEYSDTHQAGNTDNDKEDKNSVAISPKCPFGYDSHDKVKKEGDSVTVSPKCPFGFDSRDNNKKGEGDSVALSPKCPFGYDTQTFKLGPLSCVICHALLFESSKCMPCSHKFCKACISRFNDCPLCGADIEKIEPDVDLQEVVDRFIEGHARIKRSQVNSDSNETGGEHKNVVYEDVSLERGAFLVQHAVRAFHAQNIESAKSRLSLCVEDIREQLERMGNTSELCSQLGAVLGMLGDCCRVMGNAGSAITYYEESVEFLSKLSVKDLEVAHTLSVSLNKIGDLKYYDGDLQAARSYYSQSLDVRRNAAKDHSDVPSQIVDVAVSLAKVADVDRSLGSEHTAADGFQEAIKCLESLTLNSNETALEQRRLSVLEFLQNQLAEHQDSAPISSV